ncbi:serine/threonine-protein kinase [Lentzea tibetensis]|uniref:serine/threonine-protein kinase n=1 Tax=Lentzea tibetensis TaxID=2591470 RepID=UPI001F331C50|nr:serine/threonine-protein kinase [Lentzea tibetensis]
MSDTERQVAGRYRLRERLGRGAMGIVWHGYDEQLHRVVAIKELIVPDNSDDAKADKAKSRAMREARLAARLEHPHAIRVYDVVEDDGQPWLVMEYLPSRSLAGLITENGAVPPKDVAMIGAQIASALAAAHKHGILHRDVKPANILVGDQDVKITDFGISRAADDVTATATGTVGTPAYFSPEVARGEEAGFPSDVFSLGATLYTAVEGTPPFGTMDNALAMLHKVATGEYRTPEKAGPLLPVLERMLHRDPAERPTMDESVKLLAAVAQEEDDETVVATAVLPEPEEPEPTEVVEPVEVAVPPIPARPEVDPARPAAFIPTEPAEDEGRKKAGPLITAAVLILLLIVALGAYFLWPKKNTPQDASPSNPASASSQAPTSAGGQPPASAPQTQSQPPSSPPASATQPPASSAVTPPPAATNAAQALTDYYNLLPGDLNAGWARLTDNFKAGRGLDFGQYQSFWNRFSDVNAVNVTQQGDAVVSATINYTNKDGSTFSEQHTYTLVQVNGSWMVDNQS